MTNELRAAIIGSVGTIISILAVESFGEIGFLGTLVTLFMMQSAFKDEISHYPHRREKKN